MGLIYKRMRLSPQVDREYKVISALHGVGFPVPRPFLYCDDRSVVGTEFYVMECVKVCVSINQIVSSLTPLDLL